MSRSSTSSHNSDMSRPSSEKRISVPDISSDAKLELARKVPMRSKSHSNMMRRRSREIRIFEEEEEPPTLVTLFSVPLAYRDGSGKLTAMETLDYETERDLLWQCFCEASRDICLRFGFATTDRLRTEVTKKVRALHYSGHGAETFLSFEDGRGGLQVLETDNLRRLCEAGKKALNGTSSLEFVFVSACHSKFVGEAFAAAGVPHVVCVNVSSSLLDKAAHVFTRAFYLSLAMGDTVQNAFDIANRAVEAAPLAYSPRKKAIMDSSGLAHEAPAKFLLLPEDKPHDVAVFPNCRKVPQWPPSSQHSQGKRASVNYSPKIAYSPANSHSMVVPAHLSILPSRPEDFMGRNVDMYKVLASVLQRRFVTITGATTGIGKSTLAVAVANYARERDFFQGGIIYLKLIGVKKLDKLVDKLLKKLGGSGSPVRSPTKLDSFDILKRARDTDRLVDLRTRAAGPGSRLVRRSWSNSHESLSMVKDLLAEMAEEERGKFEKRCKLLFERLRRRRCLIILDNCDDLLENAKFDVRDFVGSLLDTTKGCRVLLTARTNLGGFLVLGRHCTSLHP